MRRIWAELGREAPGLDWVAFALDNAWVGLRMGRVAPRLDWIGLENAWFGLRLGWVTQGLTKFTPTHGLGWIERSQSIAISSHKGGTFSPQRIDRNEWTVET